MLAVVFLSSCNSGDNKAYDDTKIKDPLLFCKTVKQLNNVVLENNFPPMIASRNYAYANIAAYEVMVLGDSRFNSLAGQIKHLPALPSIDTANADIYYATLLVFCKVGEAVTFPEAVSVVASLLRPKRKVAVGVLPGKNDAPSEQSTSSHAIPKPDGVMPPATADKVPSLTNTP